MNRFGPLVKELRRVILKKTTRLEESFLLERVLS